ncbi:zinc finger MYM-type protein 1-like [Cynara cardunculus var. scolymus]|uniref:zinc finger MYM-type protein 1-like n=1 Tax=Cynara cardunculus var. scolymus TaxID=59895 RepID=UPI000D62FFDB|nr:zinc finger MYM-type protein 1-like [Cynara cardunculus var. scolymus]
MSQGRSIAVAFHKQTEKEKNEHRILLNASIKACRFLLKNALPFRGHDEYEMSISKGMFLEILALIGDCKEDVVDESSDVSKKKQMAVVLRYVDARGIVKERFFGIVHVTGTSSSILKSAIDTLFAENGLSLKQVRGQGYDRASNMHGEFNGLKALILNENSSTYYIHCFAHQLQLIVVAVANKYDGVENFFNMLGMVINVVNASCKRKVMLRQSYKDRVQEAIGKCEIDTGTGKYQELSLIRAGDTRWGSHYKTILRLIALFPNVVEVLQYVEEDGDNGFSRTQATDLLKLSELYSQDFSHMERIALEKQFNMYYLIVRQDKRFANLSGIVELSRLLVETKKHKTYPLVYRLLKLALVLPVATATVERYFSAMKIVKSNLRNKIGDEFLNAAMIYTIEKEALLAVSNDDVITQFQKMKSRRAQL